MPTNELPSVLFLVSAIFIFGCLAAKTYVMRGITAFGSCASACGAVALLWGVEYIIVALPVIAFIFALLFYVADMHMKDYSDSNRTDDDK